MASDAARPLSPHLTIWKWGPHMLVSILHRICGNALAFAGGILFTWWLVAAASGPVAYASFHHIFIAAEPGNAVEGVTNILARIVAIGLTWSFFQHMFSGLRHFVLDTGAGYELKTNRIWAIMTIVGSVLVTAALWVSVCWMGH